MPTLEPAQVAAALYASGVLPAAWLALREHRGRLREALTWITMTLLVAAWPLWALGALLSRK